MDIRAYLRLLRRHILVICVVTIASIAISAAITQRQAPTFESHSRLIFSTAQESAPDALAGGLVSEQRAKTYIEVVESQALAQRVADEGAVDLDATQLQASVTAEVVADSSVLEITATGTSPLRAAAIAQAYAEATVEAARDIETPLGGRSLTRVTVIDQATVPASPSRPALVLNLVLGGLLGLSLGLALALLRGAFDRTVTSPGVLAEITGTGVVATVPRARRRRPRGVFEDFRHAPQVEAMRTLRTNVQFAQLRDGSRLFVVTSPHTKEGKTTTAVNLAVSLARAGQRTVLVDADLRRPSVGGSFTLESSVGLHAVLTGRASLDSALQHDPTHRLDILATDSATRDSSELIQSTAMSDLLQQLRERYDAVVVDTAPLIPFSDAAVLSARADGTIVVVRHGKTTIDQTERAVATVSRAGGTAVGIVLNRVPAKEGDLDYRRYRGYRPRHHRRIARGDRIVVAHASSEAPR